MTSTGATGTCIHLEDCQPILKERERRQNPIFGRCGFNGKREIVCCPPVKSKNENPRVTPVTDSNAVKERPSLIGSWKKKHVISSKYSLQSIIFIKKKKYLQFYLFFVACRSIDLHFQIQNGSPAEVGEFPFLVALGYEANNTDDANSNGIAYNCGGALISTTFVLTAAHCVTSSKNDRIPIEVQNPNWCCVTAS